MKQNLGQYYDKTSSFQRAQFDALCDLMRDNIPLDKIHTILDVGAGSGARTLDLMSLFRQIEKIDAIEPDPEMLSVAKGEYNHPKVSYHQAKAEECAPIIEGIEKPIDMVFANWSLHWVQDKDAFLEALNQKLNASSFFAFSTCEKLPDILTDMDEYVRAELLLPSLTEAPWYYLTADEWRILLAKHGWRVMEQRSYETPHFAPDSRSYLEHWFSASTAKFLYGHQMEQISDLSINDMLWFVEQKYADPDNEGGLRFIEDVTFCVAQRG